MMEINLDWIKTHFVPRFNQFTFNFKHFKEGDFGSLDQVEFESERLVGAIDFWGMNWLGVTVWDKIKEEEKMNVMFSPEQEFEKERAFDQLEKILL